MYFGLGMAQSKLNGSEYINGGGGNTTLVDFRKPLYFIIPKKEKKQVK
jgi:hypothetical protein